MTPPTSGDCILTSNFNSQYITDMVQEAGDFDILILGCLHGCGNNDALIIRVVRYNDYTENIKLSDHIIKPSFFAGTHAILYSQEGAKKVLKAIEQKPVWMHIDIYLNDLYKNEIIDVKALEKKIAYQSLEDTNNVSYTGVDALIAKTVSMESSFHPYYFGIYGYHVGNVFISLKVNVKIILFILAWNIRHKYMNISIFILLFLASW